MVAKKKLAHLQNSMQLLIATVRVRELLRSALFGDLGFVCDAQGV